MRLPLAKLCLVSARIGSWSRNHDITVNAMNNLLRWRDEHHMLPLLLIASIVLLLAIAAAAIWSHGGAERDRALRVRAAAATAPMPVWSRAAPTQAQLASWASIPAAARRARLSGLGVQEYFMPTTLGGLRPARSRGARLLRHADRCRALVFPSWARPSRRAASWPPMPRRSDAGQIVFLLHKRAGGVQGDDAMLRPTKKAPGGRFYWLRRSGRRVARARPTFCPRGRFILHRGAFVSR